ncbi:MAG: hypothetical protein AAF532_11425 [Planctomycetota bacterium]
MSETTLSTFIEQTLLEIIRGVASAQESIKSVAEGAKIGPSDPANKSSLVRTVDFDIGVAIGSEQQTKGGVGIIVGPITLGSAGQSGDKKDSTNRVQFSVPIRLPAS